MAFKFKGFLDNLLGGATNPKGNLADWAHARALYTNDDHRLAPKQKFLYHVTFNLSPVAVKVIPEIQTREINMLVKSVDLPKYNITTNLKHQYNQKRNLQTRLDYDPINITFHDDNFGQTTGMWEAYYKYYFKDGNYGRTAGGHPEGRAAAYNRGNTYLGETLNGFRYGMDNNSYYNFFESIQIWQMSRRRYTCFTLVNPLIQSWQHDTMENSASDPVQSTMQVLYETVWYGRGAVTDNIAPKGFGSESGHYDTTPSPLTIEGGGTSSFFGQGGVAEGGLGVLGDITSGNAFKSPTSFLGTVLKGANVFKNAKSLSRGGLREEGFNILKGAIGGVGNVNIVGGVANTLFPKSSGSFGVASTLTKAIPGIAIASKLLGSGQTSSIAEIGLNLVKNPVNLNAFTLIANQAQGMKKLLNDGASPIIQNLTDVFNAQPEAVKNTANNETLNQLETLSRQHPNLTFT